MSWGMTASRRLMVFLMRLVSRPKRPPQESRMSWGSAVILRLVALGGFIYFTDCEAEGIYEFLMAEQGSFTYIVKAGVGFAVAGALLPMYAGFLYKHGQWIAGTACWIALPLVMSMVLYAAINRVGGTADQAQLDRDRTTRAGSLAAKTEKEATESWEEARDTAKRECTSGPVKLQRGGKCLEAEGKRDTAWATVLQARVDLKAAPETQADSGARRVAAILPITEAGVRLYQPLVVPVTMAVLASLCALIAMILKTPPMPRPWKNWRGSMHSKYPPMPTRSVVIDVTPEALPEPITPLRYRPRPKLAVTTRQPIGAVLDFLHDGLEIVAGSRTEIAAAFIGYTAWCKANLLRPMDVVSFHDALEGLCRQFGIRVHTEGDQHYLVDVRLKQVDALLGKLSR
jgi:hypothetical protein